MTVRSITDDDLTWLLALNQAHAVELSPLQMEDLKRLIDEAFYARVAGDEGAFMIAFEQSADYDSPNFLWFRQQLPNFVYVDRIVVASHARRQGLARALYDDLFERAGAAGHHNLVCEVNSDPPNPGSDAFHAALGFLPMGEARLEDRGKSVRYLRRTLGR